MNPQPMSRRAAFWFGIGSFIGWLDGMIAIVLWPWHHESAFDRFGTVLVSMLVTAGFAAALSFLAEIPARILARLSRIPLEAWHRGSTVGGALLFASWAAILKLHIGGGAGRGRAVSLAVALLAAVAVAWLVAGLGRRKWVESPRVATPRWAGVLACTLLAAALVSAWRPGSADRADDVRPNVVLISIDTLRADHLGLYGYTRDTSPHIDELGRESVIFENAYPQSNWTLPSHASMLTGLDPLAHGVTGFDSRLSQRHGTLAEWFHGAGYWTGAWVGRNRYSYVGSTKGFAQGFQIYEHSPHPKRYRSGILPRLVDEAVYLYKDHTVGRATAQVDVIRRWLGSSPPEPFFAFIHLDDVHSQIHRLPYDAPPPYRDRFCPGQIDGYSGCEPDGLCATNRLQAVERGSVDLDPGEIDRIACLYDGAIAFTDHEIGRLVAEMRAQGLLDRTIFVLTADHGEALLEHGKTLHSALYEPVTRVPLLIRLPGERVAGRRAGIVELIDLAPTILHLAGLESSEALPGEALFAASELEADHPTDEALVVGRPPGLPLVLRAGDLKYIEYQREVEEQNPDRPTEELYDLSTDPGETRNLAGAHEGRLPPLQTRLEDRVRRSGEIRRERLGDAGEETVEVPDAEKERLRALGYLE